MLKEAIAREANYYCDKPIDSLKMTKRIQEIGIMRKD